MVLSRKIASDPVEDRGRVGSPDAVVINMLLTQKLSSYIRVIWHLNLGHYLTFTNALMFPNIPYGIFRFGEQQLQFIDISLCTTENVKYNANHIEYVSLHILREVHIEV